MDFASNNLQWLICHETKRNQTKTTTTINIIVVIIIHIATDNDK